MDAAALAVWHAAGASEPVRFAAGELARYLGRLAGGAAPDGPVVALRVAPAGAWPALEVRAGPAGGAPGDRPPDASGPPAGGPPGDEGRGVCAALAARVRPVAAPFATSPGADAFLWRTGAGGLRLAGTNPRSTLFGVYDLLEALGCRFYGQLPDDEVVPAAGAAAVAAFLGRPAERFQQATFPYRERHLLEWVDAGATRREIDATAKRRMNGFVFHIEDFAPDAGSWRVVLDELVPEIARRGLLPGIGEHGGYPLWLPPERYAAAHPEWYAEVGGRCTGELPRAGRRRRPGRPGAAALPVLHRAPPGPGHLPGQPGALPARAAGAAHPAHRAGGRRGLVRVPPLRPDPRRRPLPAVGQRHRRTGPAGQPGDLGDPPGLRQPRRAAAAGASVGAAQGLLRAVRARLRPPLRRAGGEFATSPPTPGRSTSSWTGPGSAARPGPA